MFKRPAVAWAFYDWANSAFATTVMAGFFPVFFKEYWNLGVSASLTTYRLGWANSLASIAVALMAPLLGAIADKGGRRKRFLAVFALLGILATCGLFFIAQGKWFAAAVLYMIGLVGFAGGEIFYDALLPVVADEPSVDRVSALGYSLGYLGGGLLFAINVWMALSPSMFGLKSPAAAIRFSFLTVAVWWAVFTIPLFLWVGEPRVVRAAGDRAGPREGLRRLWKTFQSVRKLKVTFLFLIGYWVYIDGVDTIIRMAVDYGLAIGFPSSSLITALLITQFIGFPAALAFGAIGSRFGPKRGIYICLGVYLGVTAWGYVMDNVIEFYILAVIIGLVQGGIQSLSRSLFTRLIPPGRTSEFFGFYNVMGKFASVIGPALMGYVGLVSGSPRLAIASVATLFVAGALILRSVDEEAGKLAAANLK